MTLSEFKLLVTNITAIVNQTFTIQCGEFATALANDKGNDLSTSSFNTDQHFENFDFQAVLDHGYHDMNDLEAQFNAAWDLANPDHLADLVNKIPGHLPKLTKKLKAKELSDWIKFCLNTTEDAPIYPIHHYIISIFNVEEDESQDIIREAIAYDKIDELENNASKITSNHILIDDLITAATIESFNSLGWLLKHVKLTDDEVIQLLEANIDDPSVSAQVFKLLSLESDQRSRILQMAQSKSCQAIVDLLR